MSRKLTFLLVLTSCVCTTPQVVAQPPIQLAQPVPVVPSGPPAQQGPPAPSEQPAPVVGPAFGKAPPPVVYDERYPLLTEWVTGVAPSLAEIPPRGPGGMGSMGGMGGPGGGGGGGGRPALFSPSYRATWFPQANVVDQPATLSSIRQEFAVNCPLWKDSHNMVGLTTSVRNTIFDTNAILPETHQPFPDQLWDIRFGINWFAKLDNGWSVGASVSIGSASDKPFASIDELNGSILGFLRIPSGEKNAWIFSLMYSPTSEVAFPIPGVAYYWQPSDRFNMNIGVPFKVWWQPIDDLTLEASYFPVTTVRTKITYRVWGGVFVYGAFDMLNESYFLADRPDRQDRFFYFDDRLTGGLRMQFGRSWIVDLNGGYAFNRTYFEGHNRSDRNNRVDLYDSPFLSFMAEWRF